jgi:hypothetical protein
MVLDATNEQAGGMNTAPALVDEYLDLKEKLEPLEKRLEQVKNLLKDLVTEEGPFVDELWGVTVYLQPRFRKEYDAERLLATFPSLAGCVRPAVDVTQLSSSHPLGHGHRGTAGTRWCPHTGPPLPGPHRQAPRGEANHAGGGRVGALMTEPLGLSACSACRTSSTPVANDFKTSVPNASRQEYQWVVSQYERAAA